MSRKPGLTSGPVRATPEDREAMLRLCMAQPDGEMLAEALGLVGDWDDDDTPLDDPSEDELGGEEGPG